MRSSIETAVIITACGSAVFWFMSAMCRLPSIKADMDEFGYGNGIIRKRCKE